MHTKIEREIGKERESLRRPSWPHTHSIAKDGLILLPQCKFVVAVVWRHMQF